MYFEESSANSSREVVQDNFSVILPRDEFRLREVGGPSRVSPNRSNKNISSRLRIRAGDGDFFAIGESGKCEGKKIFHDSLYEVLRIFSDA